MSLMVTRGQCIVDPSLPEDRPLDLAHLRLVLTPVCTSRLEPLSCVVGPLRPSTLRSSATATFNAALSSYGCLGRDRQGNWGSSGARARGVWRTWRAP